MIRPLPLLRSRRAFLGDIGGGALALAVLSPVAIAACSGGDDDDSAGDPGSDSSDPDVETDEPTAESIADDAGDAPDTDGVGDAGGELRWSRANLGFVSAYVVARGNKAAIVDTGGSGSADTIGESLAELGLNYSDVESLILTHNHDDHIGSVGEVMEMAVNATVFIGEADIERLTVPATGLVGGEDVFGMEILATPGHTPGSMSAFDRAAGLLIAGDAMVVEDGVAAEAPAQFTASVTTARESVQALADLSFNTLLVGHGAPIETAADQAVAELAASF